LAPQRGRTAIDLGIDRRGEGHAFAAFGFRRSAATLGGAQVTVVETETQMIARLPPASRITPCGALRLGIALWLLALLSGPARAAEEFELEVPEAPDVTVVTEEEPARAVLSLPWGVMQILDADVAPGERRRLFLRASESFAGDSVEIPVLAVRGKRAGPVVCMTAGVHGDELNGIEIVRHFFEHADPKRLSGTLLGVPVANLHGFRRGSRYLPDRRDLNRYFPGHPAGSSASRIANALFDGVVRHCDALVDFHTGSFYRTNLPQLRGDLQDARVLELVRAFGIGVVVHSEGLIGTLRRASTDAEIPAITYEAGEPTRFQDEEIARGVEGMRNLLRTLGVLDGDPPAQGRQRIYYSSRWVRVDDGGIFINRRKLGERVGSGDLLGIVTDPVSNERTRLIAPVSGRILGMAVSQVVIPGFAAFHIGIGTEPLEEVGTPAPGAEVGGVAPPRPGAILTPDQLEAEENPE
jgi:predicted deacylase